ncbi:MAG: hypothetical protein IJG63_00485 [Oscillospiraceae bacterium]|nr:hypothetical protein [Oscillospiraceae bacterium]
MNMLFVVIGAVCGCAQYLVLYHVIIKKMSSGCSSALMLLQLPIPLFLVAFSLLNSVRAALSAVTGFFVTLLLIALIFNVITKRRR